MKIMKLPIVLLVAFLSSFASGAEPPPPEKSSTPEKPIFKDKKLEAAVRKFIFDKRDNDKPIVESDLVNLSTIQATGLELTDLSGLEKCQSLASLDLANNKIANLQPLKTLAKIQYLNLAN